MNCDDLIKDVSYWGSWASIIGVVLSIITILIAKSINDFIKDGRFRKRALQIMKKLSVHRKNNDNEAIRGELLVLKNAIEKNYGWISLNTRTGIRSLIKIVDDEHKKEIPRFNVVEGVLLNLFTIHSENSDA